MLMPRTPRPGPSGFPPPGSVHLFPGVQSRISAGTHMLRNSMGAHCGEPDNIVVGKITR